MATHSGVKTCRSPKRVHLLKEGSPSLSTPDNIQGFHKRVTVAVEETSHFGLAGIESVATTSWE